MKSMDEVQVKEKENGDENSEEYMRRIMEEEKEKSEKVERYTYMQIRENEDS